jgi:alkylation response protein AidB-like acyl-CoA dehydrogenase
MFNYEAAMELNETQTAIIATAKSFADAEIAPHALRWDLERHFPDATMRSLGALGLGAMVVREESGGTGLTRLDSVLVYEELAKACPSFSAFLSIHNMIAWMMDRFGNAQQRKRFLPKLIAMEALGSYCLTEPGCGSDAAALKTRAKRSGDHYVLNGTKQFISGAGDSDIYIVMARTGGEGAKGISAIIVEAGTPGLSFGVNEKKMGWNNQSTRQVIFDTCRVPAQNLLGAEGDGFKLAMAGLDGGRLNIAACSLGGAEAALAKALTYANERMAFGQPIDAFQNTQFKLADMETELSAARALLYIAAQKLDHGAADAGKWSAMAKRFVTDTGSKVANDALQIFGGYGYLHDYGIEKIVRDLRVHQILEGTNEIMRVIIARHMMQRGDK